MNRHVISETGDFLFNAFALVVIIFAPLYLLWHFIRSLQ